MVVVEHLLGFLMIEDGLVHHQYWIAACLVGNMFHNCTHALNVNDQRITLL